MHIILPQFLQMGFVEKNSSAELRAVFSYPMKTGETKSKPEVGCLAPAIINWGTEK
jgi:hypothetical protein